MQETIKADIKICMQTKQMDRLQTLRMISAAFTNELVAQGRPPQEELSSDDCMKVVKRLAKQRKDAIDQYVAGGRPELAEDERSELVFIEAYLPVQMSEIEVESRVREMLIANPVDITKKGIFMGSVMKALGGGADGAVVKAVIDRLVV